MVEIESCFLQQSISTIDSNCTQCNTQGIARDPNPTQLSCLVKICSLMTMGFLIVSLLSSLGFHYLILNFEIQTFVTVSG